MAGYGVIRDHKRPNGQCRHQGMTATFARSYPQIAAD
jgi:hypothetical protein